MSAELYLTDATKLEPLRDQVLVAGMTHAVETPLGSLEVAGAVRTESGLIVAQDVREHETSEARKVPLFYVVLQAGPKAAETAGQPIARGDVLLIDAHYRHSTPLIGGQGWEVMSVQAFVCKVGKVVIPTDEPDGN
jgi:hypothetical protein